LSPFTAVLALPSPAKVDLLLRAVHAMESLCEAERDSRLLNDSHGDASGGDASKETTTTTTKKKKSAPLGADDLFPVFVFVLVQSDLWKGGEMLILREVLTGLANPERQRWSASAYYVATLEAAIEHIKAT